MEIKAGGHSKEKTIFKGIIVSQNIVIDAEAGPTLRIKCKDEAVATAVGRKNAIYVNCTDSDIIKNVLGKYPFSKQVFKTAITYEKVVQYAETDWDFLNARAARTGLVVVTDDGTIRVEKPSVSDSSVATLRYGESIIELNLSLVAENQVIDVTAQAWGASSQSVIEGKSTEPTVNKEGALTGKTFATVLSVHEVVQSPLPLEKEALDSLANAHLLSTRLSRFQGTIVCEGTAVIKPNTLVELQGVGNKFNGDCYVSAVSHTLEEGQWVTRLTIGLQKESETSETTNHSLKAAVSIPAIHGLHIGTVKNIADDPAGEFRVQVTLPLMQAEDEGIWARLSTLFASNGFGTFFYPEIGDEVLLGFLDDNPSAPIILGSVYSSANTPKLTPDRDNSHKAISTRSGLSIDFDDKNKTITIETPGNNKIIVSDQDKGITITDQNNNKVALTEAGILMDSQKDILLKAANNISLTATHIDVKASGDVNMTSSNTNIKANTSYTAEGGASAELKSSGNVSVKGAMVGIN